MAGSKHNNFFGERFLVASEYRLLRHLLLVVTIVLFTFWEMKDIYLEGSRWFPVVKSSVISLLVIYLNMYILVPHFLLKRRWYGVYLLTVFYVILLVSFAEIRLNDAVYLKYTPKIRELYGKVEINPLLQILTSVFSLVVLMISSSAVVLFRKWANHDVRVHDLEKAAIQVELEQLKKQVNPQFLIRMLDKAEQENSEDASAILLSLGNILRYQLYDSTREFVLLSADIHFLTEFLTLEQRSRNNFSFTVYSDGNLYNYLVPPLLFLPFVEYVISGNTEISFIHLHFQVDNDTLTFECRYPGITRDNPKVLFDNICRRLTLLYGNSYLLDAKNENDRQVIRLCIPHQKNHSVSNAS